MTDISEMPESAPVVPVPVKISFGRRVWRVCRRPLRSLALIYLLVGLAMYFLQTMLIFPGASSKGKPEAMVRPRAGEELVQLKTQNGTSVVGVFGKAELMTATVVGGRPGRVPVAAEGAAAVRPAVLFFYGNGDCMANNDTQSEMFRAMGYHCLLIDYPGYGMSGGTPGEQPCYDAAEAAYQYLRTRADVDQHKIVIAGWSLGGGVAIELVHRHRSEGTIAALMTFCTFSSLVDRAAAEYPFLPVRLMLKHRFMSTDKLPDLSLPYFAGHGKADSIIPFSHLDKVIAAYGGSPSNLTRFVSEKADHNDFFDVGGEPLKQAINDFLARALR